MVVGFGKTNGSFQLGTIQNFGSAWSGYPSLVDFNQDGKADLLWNIPPHYDSDVDTYTFATSNGDGTFKTLEQGVVYTGQGFFQVPWTGTASKLPISLVIVSNQQNSISSALFVVNGFMESRVYLPVVRN